jgi:hypothetical protein
VMSIAGEFQAPIMLNCMSFLPVIILTNFPIPGTSEIYLWVFALQKWIPSLFHMC